MNLWIAIFLLISGVCAVTPPGGGSDYVMYSIGEYLTNATSEVWYTPWNLRPVSGKEIIGTFHMAPEEVASQMMTMLNRGQDQITLVLWFSPLSKGLDNVYGHIVNSTGGTLSEQHQQNLANVMQLIMKVGFKRVYFRFATQLAAHPFYWDSWNETQELINQRYLENYAFQKQVRTIIYNNFDTSIIPLLYRLIFDLCLETGGVTEGQAQNYTFRMWTDYTKEFGHSDTYGFTIPAPNLQRVQSAVQVYDKVGIRPQLYAFDIYGDEEAALSLFLSNFSEQSKPILIQECYLNDVTAFQGFMNAAEKYNINLFGIFQWPLARSSDHKAFSVDYPPDYTAFLYNVSGFMQADPNPCSISQAISWTTENEENPCIFLITTNDPNPRLFECGKNGSSAAPWISTNSYFNFELRQSYFDNSTLLATVNVTAV